MPGADLIPCQTAKAPKRSHITNKLSPTQAPDIAAFGLQFVAAVLLVAAGIACIALPFAGLTMLIGFVKISNTVCSGGRDFSGLLSTALNHLVVKKYALPAVRAH